MIEEPLGGAHRDHHQMAGRLKIYLVKCLRELVGASRKINWSKAGTKSSAGWASFWEALGWKRRGRNGGRRRVVSFLIHAVLEPAAGRP